MWPIAVLFKKKQLSLCILFKLSTSPGLFKFNILFLNILLVLIGIIPYSEFTGLNNIYIYIYIYIYSCHEMSGNSSMNNYKISNIIFHVNSTLTILEVHNIFTKNWLILCGRRERSKVNLRRKKSILTNNKSDVYMNTLKRQKRGKGKERKKQ